MSNTNDHTNIRFIDRAQVLELIEELFLQEHVTLRAHPQNEQTTIGAKIVVIEIELKKRIKGLTFIESNNTETIATASESETQAKSTKIKWQL